MAISIRPRHWTNDVSDIPTLISFAEAQALLDEVAGQFQLSSERIGLSRALGRILAQDLIAEVDLPSFDNSAMDGFAFRWRDVQGESARLQLAGEQFAGLAQAREVGQGQCIRVTTGAALPIGSDTVVVKENCTVLGTGVDVRRPTGAGANIRRRGEDVRSGDVVLSRGQVLSPAALSLAAALGLPEIDVHRKPSVALFTTGDELRPPGVVLQPGQVHDSNRILLQTLLAADGFEPVTWPLLPDDPDRMLSALRDAAQSFDVIITCGGVSAGERDYLPGLLAKHGETYFWKVRMRPGMPLLAGRLGAAHLLCLPGNPVSVFATYLTLGRRFLDGLQARGSERARHFARLSIALDKTHERREFLRGKLACDAAGQWHVQKNPADGSHRLRAVADSNALIVVPEGAGHWPAGSVLEVMPLGEP